MGWRCQRTISISAAEAMNANGAVVWVMFSFAIVKKGRPELAERIALIRMRLTTQ